jgi:hypothetical protein
MKAISVLCMFLVFLLVCSCSREGSVLSDYRTLARDLKKNSSEYTLEDWEKAAKKFQRIEKRAARCKFSPKEKKELNKLRGKCAAYMLTSVSKQAITQYHDIIGQFSDIADGFKEGLVEEGIEGIESIEGLEDLEKILNMINN